MFRRYACTSWVPVFLVTCFLCLGAPNVYGQVSAAGAIMGTVSDPTGAVIPDTEVSVTNTATAQSRLMKTTAAGFYSAEALSVGTYDVTIKKEGFKTFLATGVKVDPGTRVSLNATLEVGSATTEVTVAASAVRVETASGESGGVISGNQIQDLLLNGRNLLGLGLLIPGVNSASQTGRSVGGGSLTVGGLTGESPLSINGLGREWNLYSIDGEYNMNTGANINLNVTPPLDATSEFRIMKDNYSAKYGVMAGQVMMESKSGTSQLHGAVYEYLRNDKLDASNFFESGIQKTPLRQNNYGFSIGGPVYIPGHYNVKKTKTFFFANEDWRKRHTGLTLRGSEIPQALRDGDFTNSPTLGTGGLQLDASSQALLATAHPGVNCVPDTTHLNTACFDQNSVILMNKFFALPNNPVGGFLNYINPGVDKIDQRNDTYRIDHHFSEKLSLMGRFSYERVNDTPPAATWTPNPSTTTTQTILTTSFNNVLRFTANISPSTINQVSIGQTDDKPRLREHGDILPSGMNIQYVFPLATADNGRNRIPEISIAKGWAGLAKLWVDASDNEDTIADDFTTVRGSHVLQAGMLWIAGIKRQNWFNPTTGSFSFSGVHANDPVADYLLGLDSSFTQSGFEARGYMHYRQFEAYFQDDWRVTKKLTLNLGLREAYFSNTTMDGDFTTDFDPRRWDPAKAPAVQPNGLFVQAPDGTALTAAGTPADELNGIVYDGHGGVPRGIFSTPKFNLGPRIGFAYDVFGDGKTALRGGYGIAYSRIPFCDYGSLGNPPLITTVTILNGTMTNPAAGAVSGAKSPQGLNMCGPPGALQKQNQVMSWSFTVERELVPNGVLSVGYVGSGGRHLRGSLETNFPLPVAAPSINDPGCLQSGQTIPSGGFQFDPCLNKGIVSADYTRPFVGWSGISGNYLGATSYEGTSNYHSLQVGWKYTAGHGFTMTSAYTWGKALTDIAARGFDARTGSGGAQDARNYKAEYGPPGWDRTHIFTAGYIWDLPILRGRSDYVGKAFGGWTFSGITVIESGWAFAPGLATGTGGLASRPDCAGSIGGPKSLAQWFNTSAFTAPAFGFFGSCGTGIIRGPGENTWNMALFKSFPIKERAKLQFRSEFFNAWNHPNFDAVSVNLGAPNFGQVTRAMEPRQIEFSLRLDF